VQFVLALLIIPDYMKVVSVRDITKTFNDSDGERSGNIQITRTRTKKGA
jgi:hypothetical protein